ncbi:hypothetical protein WN51_01857 [Melipona quadrifasciata]|uniref:Uncharacterized protein n=1 Tax=Melipona quadrifasciata TaxID=166423 RepID=A0A0M8ZXH4_9HYME|nr:hypothetical protein WN51_01857 [Melipona quadrifasciata]
MSLCGRMCEPSCDNPEPNPEFCPGIKGVDRVNWLGSANPYKADSWTEIVITESGMRKPGKLLGISSCAAELRDYSGAASREVSREESYEASRAMRCIVTDLQSGRAAERQSVRAAERQSGRAAEHQSGRAPERKQSDQLE